MAKNMTLLTRRITVLSIYQYNTRTNIAASEVCKCRVGLKDV